jgi:hypothetical protein
MMIGGTSAWHPEVRLGSVSDSVKALPASRDISWRRSRFGPCGTMANIWGAFWRALSGYLGCEESNRASLLDSSFHRSIAMHPFLRLRPEPTFQPYGPAGIYVASDWAPVVLNRVLRSVKPLRFYVSREALKGGMFVAKKLAASRN